MKNDRSTRRANGLIEMEYRCLLDGRVVEVAARLIESDPDSLDDDISWGLERISSPMDVDRCYLFQIARDDQLVYKTHEWTAEGIPSHKAEVQGVPLEALAWALDKLSQQGVLVVEHREEVPSDSMVRALMESGNTQSILIVPLTVRGSLVGAVGFDAVTAAKSFDAYEIHTLKLMSSILAGALERRRQEAELRRSESNHRKLVENAAEGIGVVQDGEIVFANRVLCEVTGRARSEVLGHMFHEFLHPDDLAEHAERHRKRMEGAALEVKREECRIRRADGEVRWVETRSVTIEWAGRPAALTFVSDTTERKLATDEILTAAQRYRTLFNAGQDAITVVALDDKGMPSKYLDANDVACELIEYTREELAQIRPADLYDPSQPVDSAATVRKVLTEGSALFERTMVSRSGRLIPVEINSRVTEVDGRPAILSVARDVSSRHAAVTALRASEEHLQAIYQAAPDAIFTKDCEGRYTQVNPIVEGLFGMPADRIVGHSDTDLGLGRTDGVSAETDRRALDGGTAEFTFTRKMGGKERTLHVKKVPLRGENGKVLGLCGIARDVTEAKRLEKELARAEKLESIGSLAGGIAHDFNNILTGVLGNVSLARLDLEGQRDACSLLDEADRALMRARSLTQQLLTFAKGGVPVRDDADLSELLRDCCEFTLRGSNTKFAPRFDEDLHQVSVDTGQMGQVVSNLVLNASQSMPEGGQVEVAARNESVGQSSGLPLSAGEYVVFEVIDCGVGISPKHLDRVFDPFFTTKQQGHGLGLASAYSIIRNHGGHIECESELGRGTVFRVYLPASPVNQESERKPMTLSYDEPVASGRILIMDDEAVIRDVARRTLRRIGFSTAEAGDDVEALEIYRQAQERGEPFDLVVLDLTIPGGRGGVQVIQMLKEIDPDIKALVCSGYSNDPVLAKPEIYGFCGIVPKPFKPPDLVKAVRKAIG